MQVFPSIPEPRSFRSPVHDDRTAAVLGVALGVAFGVCMLTGLVSHTITHPLPGWEWPAAPRDLYRFLTATHTVTGAASVPLLLAKLWVVYPKLWRRPPFAGLAHAVERIGLIALVGGTLLLFVSGIEHVLYLWPNAATVVPMHYAAAWIATGGLVLHVVAKYAATVAALRVRPVPPPAAVHPDGPAAPAPVPARPPAAPGGDPGADDPERAADRRRFLVTVGAAAGLVGVNFLAANVTPLSGLALLPSRRADVGVQGLPVQTMATAARVQDAVTDAGFRLRVTGLVAAPLELDVDELVQRAHHRADLPISCVQGWSAGASWRGVPVRDLLAEAGVTDFTDVIVRSVQTVTAPQRLFGRARLNRAHALHPDTLLATELNGERLHLDHGFPVRLIAPTNPGVMQTKWVEELIVR